MLGSGRSEMSCTCTRLWCRALGTKSLRANPDYSLKKGLRASPTTKALRLNLSPCARLVRGVSRACTIQLGTADLAPSRPARILRTEPAVSRRGFSLAERLLRLSRFIRRSCRFDSLHCPVSAALQIHIDLHSRWIIYCCAASQNNRCANLGER